MNLVINIDLKNWRKKENKKEEKEAVEEDDEQQMGGGPPGVFHFHIKDPTVVLQEGDPPIGNERGALGVGTGPAYPPTNPPPPQNGKIPPTLKTRPKASKKEKNKLKITLQT